MNFILLRDFTNINKCTKYDVNRPSGFHQVADLWKTPSPSPIQHCLVLLHRKHRNIPKRNKIAPKRMKSSSDEFNGGGIRGEEAADPGSTVSGTKFWAPKIHFVLRSWALEFLYKSRKLCLRLALFFPASKNRFEICIIEFALNSAKK